MKAPESDFCGMLVINKEAGYTSSDVVAKLRGILHLRRIGHTGTLDPAAVGVLPVCLGPATRLAGLVEAKDKEYLAVLRLGTVTDTQDATGNVLSRLADEQVAELAAPWRIREAVRGFNGEIQQIPPMYSAVRIGGKRLYEYAREGKEIERAPRTVTISDIRVECIALPLVTLRVTCSRGTYIRTLCEDIGRALGTGGCMEHLVRTRVGDFTLDQAWKLSALQEIMDGQPEKMRSVILPADSFFADAPKAHVTEDSMKYLRNGNALSADNLAEDALPQAEHIRVYGADGTFFALYRYDAARRRILPVCMLHATDSAGKDRH